jgi:hypothetical protein
MESFGSEMLDLDFFREPPIVGIDSPLPRPLRASAIPPATPATAAPPAKSGVLAFEAISESVDVCSWLSSVTSCALVDAPAALRFGA